MKDPVQHLPTCKVYDRQCWQILWTMDSIEALNDSLEKLKILETKYFVHIFIVRRAEYLYL